MDWFESQSLKNLLRRTLGVRLYGRIGRLVRPKQIVSAYGSRPIQNGDQANTWLHDALLAARPFAAGKIGASELRAIRAVSRSSATAPLSKALIHELHLHSGVFPPESDNLRAFVAEYSAALQSVDLLAVWFNQGEQDCVDTFAPRAELCRTAVFDAYLQQRPWTHALAGKRVVVVSPFARSIENQYARRTEVWAKVPGFLPDFQLRTVRAPLSDFLVPSRLPDWHASLAELRSDLLAAPFDVALIGAGAYSIPLAAAARSAGSAGIHLGGTTQIYFGVRGGRWDAYDHISALMTDAWVRPSGDEVPSDFRKMEGGCYW